MAGFRGLGRVHGKRTHGMGHLVSSAGSMRVIWFIAHPLQARLAPSIRRRPRPAALPRRILPLAGMPSQVCLAQRIAEQRIGRDVQPLLHVAVAVGANFGRQASVAATDDPRQCRATAPRTTSMTGIAAADGWLIDAVRRYHLLPVARQEEIDGQRFSGQSDNLEAEPDRNGCASCATFGR